MIAVLPASSFNSHRRHRRSRFTSPFLKAHHRPWKVQDASGRWAKTEYNARGYLVALCESNAGDDAPACAVNHDKFRWLQETDARGQVVRERWANHESMDLVRTYGAGTGRIARICGGNDAGTCHLMDEGTESPSQVWSFPISFLVLRHLGPYPEDA